MTNNEIIKALMCCGDKNCKYCPNFSEDIECSEKLIKLSLDLINRQKAEIEQLTEENNALNGNTEKYILECEKRSREIAEDYEKEIKGKKGIVIR